MASVQTVTGPVEAGELGLTLFHEHVVFSAYVLPEPAVYDWDQVVDRATEELKTLASKGVKTLVDPTGMGNARNPEALAEISRRSGVRIIAAAGFWQDPPLKDLLGSEEVDAVAERIVGDLTDGMDGTGMRAGVIKIATGAEITPTAKTVFKAAVRASRETGAGIVTHTADGALALEQLELLEREGADLSRVVIGHLNDRPDPKLHLEIVRRGAGIGYDRMGRTWRPEDVCLELIPLMAREGYLSRVFISHDAVLYMAGIQRRPSKPWEQSQSREQTPSFSYISTVFLDKLRKVGITEGQIHTLMVENPARLLCG